MEVNKTTVSETEIDNFNKLADEWWSRAKTLHKLNEIRIPALIENLEKNGLITKEASISEKPLLGLNILDVGCGAGVLSEPLAILGGNITGLDISKEMIECAKIHAKNNKNITNNITYVCDTIEHFSDIHSNEYDVIVASEIVEHVNDVELFIESCVKAVKVNGAVYITTINRTMRSWLIAIILFEYILNIIPRGMHEWNKFVTPEETEKNLEKLNCKITITCGWSYNYFQGKFSSSDDLSVFYYTFALKN